MSAKEKIHLYISLLFLHLHYQPARSNIPLPQNAGYTSPCTLDACQILSAHSFTLSGSQPLQYFLLAGLIHTYAHGLRALPLSVLLHFPSCIPYLSSPRVYFGKECFFSFEDDLIIRIEKYKFRMNFNRICGIIKLVC